MLSTFGLLGTIWLSGCLAQNEKYCLSHDPNPYLYYATKTAYQFVYEKRITSHNVPNCEPVQLWLMSRHGTRYPGNDGLSILMNLTSFRDTVVYNHETRKSKRSIFSLK
ncbi:hypothetical protein AAG570_005573 [Ranatra chinensis]|uniref:Multiple inositol polyphosphate phosphatase 1 n=1 Tax=Ranatra chinensis TaxID=642074 RepID=A0ABD0XY68_9HEMI